MDVELLKQGIKWARAEWEAHQYHGDWEQQTWYSKLSPAHVRTLEAKGVQTCGTRMCLAGWIVHQAGLNVIGEYGEIEWDESILGARPDDCDEDVPDAAATLIGVDPIEAAMLWAGSNTIEDLEKTAKAMVEQNGQVW